MDGSAKNMQELRNETLFWMYDLSATTAFITAANINDLITAAGFGGPLGILSIDIDGNDYWVWDKIDCVDPAIVICEYNAVLGDTRPIAVPYKADFNRFDSHYSGLYLGASIAAFTSLAKRKGYTLVGTNSMGFNAFFVRNDLAHHVLDKLDSVRGVSFPVQGQPQSAGPALIHRRHRPIRTHKAPSRWSTWNSSRSMLLDQIANPYSADWLAKMQ